MKSSFEDSLLEVNIFEIFPQLLDHRKKVVRRESCWALSNLAASNSKVVKTFLEHEDLISKLLRLL